MLKIASLIIVGIFLNIILISSVSAGIIVTPSTIDVNKSVDSSKEIEFQIENTESFSFFNISFEDNPHIQMNKITELPAGSIINVSAQVTSNQNINQEISIIGFFISQVGETNTIHNVNVTSFKSNPCDFSIIKGDSVEWRNKLFSELLMIDESTNLPVDGGTIPSNQTFTKQFNSPQIFTYHFTISGFQFPESCKISVLSDTGVVTDPEKNGKLNLNVINNFNPTTISAISSKSDYSMKFFEKRSGVITITNTGDKIAKNIGLSGDWFSFKDQSGADYNPSDLNPGDQLPVLYTLNPKIFSTNETNKTHNPSIEIKGNFPSKSLNFSVFIEHALINEDITEFGNGTALVDFICSARPELCEPQVKVIFREGSGGDRNSSVVVTQEGFNAQQLALLEQSERMEVMESFIKETVGSQSSEIKEFTQTTETEIGGIKKDLSELRSLFEDENQNNTILMITLLILGSSTILGFILLRKWRKNKREKFEQY